MADQKELPPPKFQIGQHVQLLPYNRPEFKEGWVTSIRTGIFDHYYMVKRKDGREVELDNTELAPWDEESHGLPTPENADLACLNAWPEGTAGYHRDEELIAQVNTLCKVHGYGRMHQLMQAIWEIWNDTTFNKDANISKWEAFRAERMRLMAIPLGKKE